MRRWARDIIFEQRRFTGLGSQLSALGPWAPSPLGPRAESCDLYTFVNLRKFFSNVRRRLEFARGLDRHFFSISKRKRTRQRRLFLHSPRDIHSDSASRSPPGK